MRRSRDCAGFSTGVSLIAMAASLLVLAVLLVISLSGFGGAGATNDRSSGSILSQSSAESQIKLCAEGRASSYGDPPTPMQQAWCVRQLAAQAASLPQVP